MSYRAVQAVIVASRQPGRFSHAEVRLLVNIAEHHNDKTGQCNPGYARLASETGVSRSYVVKMVEALEARGELERDDPSSKGGSGHRQQINLTLENGHSRVTVLPGGNGHSVTPFRGEADNA